MNKNAEAILLVEDNPDDAELTKLALARHGLDGASVRAANPGVIYASVRGFPSNSSRAGEKGFDGIGQAESGMLWVNGTPESGPLKLPFSPVDTGIEPLVIGVEV